MDQALMTLAADWEGYAVMQRQPAPWVVAHGQPSRISAGWQTELAGTGRADWETIARRLLVGAEDIASTSLLAHDDSPAGIFRAATFDGNCLTGAILVAPRPLVISREWLAARLGTPLDPGEKFRLLDGRPSGAMAPRGVIVCFCCDVGRNEITAAIASGYNTVAEIGLATRAGTHCGRCRPRLERLIERTAD